MVALRDVMSPDPVATGPDASIADAAATMVRGRFGSVVVLSSGTLVGIFTERDVLRAAATDGDLSTATVRDWMTPDPMTAPPAQDTEEAVATMVAQGFRHLPVVDGADLVGIVSLRDLLGARVAGDAASPSAAS